MKKSKLKNEKGAVSTLVLFTVLMFSVILTGIYMIITTRQKAQLKSDLRIQQIYKEEVDRADELYNEVVDKFLNEIVNEQIV